MLEDNEFDIFRYLTKKYNIRLSRNFIDILPQIKYPYFNTEDILFMEFANSPPDKVYEFYDQRKKRLIAKINYTNGKLDGLYEEWYNTTQQSVRKNYKDGNLHGLHEQWYINGQLLKKCYYKNGRLDGLYEQWDENRNLYIKGYYWEDEFIFVSTTSQNTKI
jgi:antitoxin component YwqK of YwqJK toxin-antitoxin module